MQNLRKFRATFFFFFLEANVARPRPKCARGLPTPRAKRARGLPHQGTNVPTPRHQRVQLAHTKAPTRAACPHQGTNLPTPRPKHARGLPTPRPKCARGLPTPRHQRIKTSFVGIFSRYFPEVLRIRL